MFFFFALLAVVCAQQPQFFPPNVRPPQNENAMPCGLTCTRAAQYTVLIDGVRTTVKCTDNNVDATARCAGCCAAKALAAGIQTNNAAGFPGTNGRDCICCINNNMCVGK